MASHAKAVASSCPLATLSFDVFAMIAEYLETKDIQSARLAGRDLYLLSSPYLFRAVTFAPHQEYLDRLERITQDPILSHNIRTLRYDVTLFRLSENKDPLDDMKDDVEFPLIWVSETYSRREQCRLLHKCDASTRGFAMEEYTAYVRQQDKILDDLERHLSQILSALPKISAIFLCNTMMKDSDKFKYALRENSISRKWARGNQITALFRVIMNTPNCRVTSISVQGHCIQKPFYYLDNSDFGDDSSIKGSVKNCLRDKFNTLTYTKEKKPFVHGSSLTLNSQGLSIFKAIFSNLTHLNLGIVTAIPWGGINVDCEDTPQAYWGDFPTVLQSLTKVVDLSLDMKYHAWLDQQLSCTYYHDDILELFGSPPIIFPRLRRLKLSSFRSCGSSIQNLLRNHAQIEDLALNFIIEIDTGHRMWSEFQYRQWTPHPDWVQCIETMRSLNLQRLDLRGIEGFGHNEKRFGSENEELTLSRIHDYILHGYGDNPLPTRFPVEKNNLAWDEELW